MHSGIPVLVFLGAWSTIHATCLHHLPPAWVHLPWLLFPTGYHLGGLFILEVIHSILSTGGVLPPFSWDAITIPTIPLTITYHLHLDFCCYTTIPGIHDSRPTIPFLPPPPGYHHRSPQILFWRAFWVVIWRSACSSGFLGDTTCHLFHFVLLGGYHFYLRSAFWVPHSHFYHWLFDAFHHSGATTVHSTCRACHFHTCHHHLPPFLPTWTTTTPVPATTCTCHLPGFLPAPSILSFYHLWNSGLDSGGGVLLGPTIYYHRSTVLEVGGRSGLPVDSAWNSFWEFTWILDFAVGWSYHHSTGFSCLDSCYHHLSHATPPA